MNMLISGISEKKGKRIAYVLFEDENRSAEAVIPACKVVSNQNFTQEEVLQLEQYMRDNLAMLKSQAASVNPITAMMKD